jgi:hypothetical protein
MDTIPPNDNDKNQDEASIVKAVELVFENGHGSVNGPDPTSAMLIAMLQEQMRHERAANERRTQEALESERQREKTRRAESRNHAARDCCCVAGGMFACILAAFVKIMADAARHG